MAVCFKTSQHVLLEVLFVGVHWPFFVGFQGGFINDMIWVTLADLTHMSF